MHNNNKLKEENRVIISIDTKKAFDENQHSFMIKTLRKVKNMSFVNLNKVYLQKVVITNITLHNEVLKVLSGEQDKNSG